MRSTAVRTSVVFLTLPLLLSLGAASADADWESSSQPSTYVADLVATASFGVAMNGSGNVVGTSYFDPGCGSSCLPPLETVIWKGAKRIVLPSVPGLDGIQVTGINAKNWVTGLAGPPGFTTHAVVWKPNGTTYEAIDLGTLPGTTVSEAIGIDDLGRVIGWSTTRTFPPFASPFMWTEAGGMVDLAAQGYPDEKPIAISPGGTVLTSGFWYRLGDPGSAIAMPPPPPGFYPAGTGPAAINDAGDQARFLASTSTQSLRYLFRLHHDGTWQQLCQWPAPGISPRTASVPSRPTATSRRQRSAWASWRTAQMDWPSASPVSSRPATRAATSRSAAR